MSEFSQFVIDQLQNIGIVEAQRMFGGLGLRLEGIFFGVIHDDRLYFKVGEDTQQNYIDAGMQPFSPNAKQTLTSYYEVPVEVLEDSDELCSWASDALTQALLHTAQKRASN